MKFFYILRQTKNWKENFTIDSDEIRCWYNDDIRLAHRKTVKSLEYIWNSTFYLSYTDFRKGLNKIREENFKRIKFHECIQIYEEEKLNELRKSNDNLFFPTDDDDWFHEDIIEIIMNKLEQNVARWKYMHLINAELTHENWHNFPNYQTNNFCVKSPCDISNFDQGDLNYKNKKSQFIDENLSIHNKTIASISYWSKNKITQNNLIQGVENVKKMNINNDVPHAFHKYIDMLYDLVLKIKFKAWYA